MKTKKAALILAFFLLGAVAPFSVLAECNESNCPAPNFCSSDGSCVVSKDSSCSPPCASDEICSAGTCYKTATMTNHLGEITFNNPTGKNSTDANALLGKIINGFLGIAGSLALLMFVYGGLMWMTSRGAPDKVKNARALITWAVFGLMTIFLAYALVNFVLGTLIGSLS